MSETYLEGHLRTQYGAKIEEIESVIPLEGAELENWRDTHVRAYQQAGLTPHEAKELCQFVETPFGLYPTEGRERFNALAEKAFQGGYQ